MGWLRELLEQSRLKSFDSLAKACLTHPHWPQDVVIQSRSLGALLGKLDRREELEWLTSRPEVQGILAELLGSRFVDLQLAMPQPKGAAERWRWRDAPRAASLELLREALPPAFPHELITFGHAAFGARGERLLWEAPRGAGQDLLGAWLEANQRVERLSPQEELHTRTFQRPLLVEIARFDSSHVQDIAQLLVRIPRTLNVLVTSPPNLHLARSSNLPWCSFTQVHHEPNHDDLHRLGAWLLRRLPKDSALSTPRAFDFVQQTLVDRHWTTFDDMLSLCGTIDEVGFDARTNLQRLFSALVSARLKRLTQDPLATWLKKHAISAISALFEELILEYGTDWEQARSVDEWSALVPQEFQSVVDVNWLKRTLPEADTHIRARDIERAAKRLSPGGFHIVLALERLGFLCNDDTGALRFAPHWLGQYLLDTVLAHSARLAAPQLGALMLSAHAPEITTRLAQSFVQARVELDSVLDHTESRELTSVVTVELTFRLTAFGLFRGIDCDSEHISDLWEAQLSSLVIDSGGSPAPLVSFPEDQATQQPLLSDGFFYVAALALSERVLPSCRPHSSLDPFRHQVSETPFRRVLDRIRVFLSSAEPSTDSGWLSEVYLLLHRVRSLVPPALKNHPAFAISQIAESSIDGTLTWSALSRIPKQPAAIEAWRRIAEPERAWSRVCSNCFASYREAGFPEHMGILAPDAAFSATFWADIPGALVVELLSHGRSVRLDLAEAAWEDVLRGWQDTFSPELLALLPSKKTHSLLQSFEQQPESLISAMWHTHATFCETFCQDLLRLGKVERSVNLLLTAPSASFTLLVPALGLLPTQVVALPPKVQSALRERLHTSAKDRNPDFQACLELLLELQATPPTRS